MTKQELLDITEMKMLAVDDITEAHCAHVSNNAVWVEKELGLPDNLLSSAAAVCDIGKQYISQNILYKKARLTDLEREIVNLHAYFGYKILTDLEVDRDIRYIVLYHHGTDMPTLAGVDEYTDKKVLLYAKMLHTIDTYTALTEDRPYRKGFSPKEAITFMEGEDVQTDVFMALKELAKIS